jgi:hypothetical protein
MDAYITFIIKNLISKPITKCEKVVKGPRGKPPPTGTWEN